VLTVATLVFVELHVTPRFVALVGVIAIVRLWVRPTFIVVVGLVILNPVICITGLPPLTIMKKESKIAELAFEVARMITEPVPRAVSRPFALTVATLVFEELHVTPRFVALAGDTVAVRL